MRARRWIILGAIAVVVTVGVVIAATLVYRPTVSPLRRTYTAANLTTILKKVKAASGTKGKVYDELQILNQPADNGLSEVIDSLLAKKGVTLIPAECRKPLAALPMANPQVAETRTEIQAQVELGIRRSCRWRPCRRPGCHRRPGQSSSPDLPQQYEHPATSWN